jgi:hypothetical protein
VAGNPNEFRLVKVMKHDAKCPDATRKEKQWFGHELNETPGIETMRLENDNERT